MTTNNTTGITNRDLLAVRAYVTAQDATQYDAVSPSTVLLDLTHSNLVQQHIEIRFDKMASVDDLRRRIHQKTGTSAQFQHLQVYSMGTVIAEIPPDDQSGHYKLGYFGLQHGTRIHCVDLNPHSLSRSGGLENTALIEKYVMSDADYNARDETVRAWGREQKLADKDFSYAQHAADHAATQEAVRRYKLGLPLPAGFVVDADSGRVVRDKTAAQKDDDDDEYGPDSVNGIIQVGQRCQVQPGQRRGRVAYTGLVPELAPGYWVGVVFDEPVGRSDGCCKGGKRYFDAADKYGGFVRGKNVETGVFPERDIFLDSDDDDEDEL